LQTYYSSADQFFWIELQCNSVAYLESIFSFQMKVYIFHISNIIELMYQFPNLLNIWNISTPFIPPIYTTEGNYEFERLAQIVVNIEQ
jgi:hypothetical protein